MNIDGNKRRIVGGLFTLAAALGYFGVITPEQSQLVNEILAVAFGAAQVDSMVGYPGRSAPGK